MFFFGNIFSTSVIDYHGLNYAKVFQPYSNKSEIYSGLIGLEKVNKILHVKESWQSFSVENYRIDNNVNKITLQNTNFTYRVNAI